MDPDEQRLRELARRLSGGTGITWNQQEQLLKLMGLPVVRSLVGGLGIDVDELLGQQRELRKSAVAILQAAVWFGEFGWAVSANQLKGGDYAEAVRLWEEAHDEAVIDEYLTRAWSRSVWLRRSYGALLALAGRHRATHDMLLARQHVLDKALKHHERGEYEASTMIVLAQVDGLTFDFTEGRHGFFYGAKDHFFEDDNTLAGMPEFMRRVRRAVNRGDRKTSMSTAFRRDPIFHGRYPAFGNEVNSTKAFALLANVLEWLRPKALELTEKWQAEHEAKNAGSDARDADGRRLDRRGFIDARESLRWLSMRETNEHRNHGRYNGDLRDMFPPGASKVMKRRDELTLMVSADGHSYWAWCPSDTAVCFGIGAHDGEVLSYRYADVGPPNALGDDSRWLSEVDSWPLEWSDDSLGKDANASVALDPGNPVSDDIWNQVTMP